MTMTDYPKIHSRQMTLRQRRKLHRAIRYIRDRNPGPVSIRFEAVTIYKKTISITIKTRRDDAHPNSMRAIICNERYHIFIGGERRPGGSLGKLRDKREEEQPPARQEHDQQRYVLGEPAALGRRNPQPRWQARGTVAGQPRMETRP